MGSAARFIPLRFGCARMHEHERACARRVAISVETGLIVGLAPGGGTDIQTRLIAQKLTDALGRPFIVENRTGAGGTVAYALIAKSPANSYAFAQRREQVLDCARCVWSTALRPDRGLCSPLAT